MAMEKTPPKCERCGVEMQGRAVLCVSCWRACLRPCLACTRRATSSRWVPRLIPGTRWPVNCQVCANERWVLRWPETEAKDA